MPLIMFFDDFETRNALGSPSVVHKLGAVYVSISCIPLYWATYLSNIFLTLTFHSTDRVALRIKLFSKHLLENLIT